MDRRTFLPGVLVLVAPIALEAQQVNRLARIGVLSFASPDPFREGFRRALGDLGYVEGRNVAIDHLAAGGDIDRLPALAAALVRANVRVIVANATPSIRAAMQATDRIPIVMATAGDALRTGLVANLARPGGNVTGLSLALVELAGKTVELLREVLPRSTRFACLVHSADPLHREFLAEAESSTRRLGLQFSPAVLNSDRELDAAFRSLAQSGVGGVVVQPIFTLDPETRSTVVKLSLAHRLPAVSGLRRFADAGGLLAYASEFNDLPKRAATYVDRILRGAAPGDLPVEQPTHFQLVFNLKTAKTLGVVIPRDLLLRADQLVE
jgi:putative ABC transport system substrate-binding protein